MLLAVVVVSAVVVGCGCFPSMFSLLLLLLLLCRYCCCVVVCGLGLVVSMFFLFLGTGSVFFSLDVVDAVVAVAASSFLFLLMFFLFLGTGSVIVFFGMLSMLLPQLLCCRFCFC